MAHFLAAQSDCDDSKRSGTCEREPAAVADRSLAAPPKANERTPRLRFRILICIAIASIGIAIFAIGLTTWALRSDAVADAVSDGGNIATVLAEQTARSVQSIDLILSEVQDHVNNLAATAPD